MQMVQTFHEELSGNLPKLRAMAIVMTHDRSAADDLMQDTVVRMLKAQTSYTPGTNFVGWAYRIMRNRHISLLRRNKHGSVPLDDPSVAAVGYKATQEGRIAQNELVVALRGLPRHQREALLLVGGAGLSYNEVAVALQCSVGTIKSRVSRARESLRQALMDHETEKEESETDAPAHAGDDRARRRVGGLRAHDQEAFGSRIG
jgi:RNA polymerase sigma-70 factor (ECF subfamily)